MNQAEAAVVLAKSAAYDDRVHVTEEQAVAWSQALHDVPVRDAVAAVVAHYRESEWTVRPAHVRRIVERVRARRLEQVTEPALPPDLSGQEYAAALRAWRRQVADGGGSDVAAALATVGRRELTGGSR